MLMENAVVGLGNIVEAAVVEVAEEAAGVVKIARGPA